MTSFDPTSLVGRQVGPVQVLAPLGRGGMGMVFRARDELGREVALKLALDPQQRGARQARFQREGEIGASLDHPGIVRVHTAGVEGQIPYLVCELVEGARTLDEACSALPVEERARKVAEAARAVGHAHERGVIHRDLKPSNVLVDDAGTVRVVDFGIAYDERYVERLTRTGVAVGTPSYMSPEHLRGKGRDVTAACDVWSLGVVLYEVLTGALPFAGENIVDLAEAIADHRITAPRTLEPSVSPAVETVCLRALALDTSERYADGNALADDLERALAGEALADAPGRPPLAAYAAAGLAAFALALGVLFWVRPGDASPARGPDASDQTAASVAQRAADALRAGDEEAALAALRGSSNLAVEQGLAAVRDALEERGAEVLTGNPDAGTRAVATLFAIGELLHAPLGDYSAGPFGEAAMRRAWEFEGRATDRLGDERTVTLMEGLARMGVNLPQVETRVRLRDFSRLSNRKHDPTFVERSFRLIVALLNCKVHVQSIIYVGVGGERYMPPYQKNGGAVQRYVWVRGAIAGKFREAGGYGATRVDLQRSGIDDHLKRLRVLVDEISVEEVGPRLLAGFLAGAAEAQAQLRPPPDDDLYPRALALCPGDPEFLSGYADQLLNRATQEARSGDRLAARETIRLARKTAEEARAACAAGGYDGVEAFGGMLQLVRRVLVRSSALLGDREAAERIIATLPRETWSRHELEQGQLQADLQTSLQVYEQVFAGLR